MKLEAMFHCVQKCNLIFSPVETYLNPQRSSRRPPSWIFIRNILIILPLRAEWMEWRSVHSGIGMRNKKTRVFYILAILIPELWIKKRALSVSITDSGSEGVNTEKIQIISSTMALQLHADDALRSAEFELSF